MIFTKLLSLTLLSLANAHPEPIPLSNALVPRTTLNGPCTGASGKPGVCIATKACTSGGGTFVNDKCPDQPEDIKCCTKPTCGSGGNCRWTKDCGSGSHTVDNLCPGPDAFKCCVPGAGSSGGGSSGGKSFKDPKFPSVGACKAVAVNGAKKIVDANKGLVREIFCTRDCSCPGTSDHCCGKATDMMCTSGGGVSFPMISDCCRTCEIRF